MKQVEKVSGEAAREPIIYDAESFFERLAYDHGQEAADSARDTAQRSGFLCAALSRPQVTDQRRVVCAAIRAADGRLLLGIRHYSRDMHFQIDSRLDGDKFRHRHDEDQGFVDQHGVFMSREEAFAVAQAAGQITDLNACGNGLNGPKLYSEGLY